MALAGSGGAVADAVCTAALTTGAPFTSGCLNTRTNNAAPARIASTNPIHGWNFPFAIINMAALRPEPFRTRVRRAGSTLAGIFLETVDMGSRAFALAFVLAAACNFPSIAAADGDAVRGGKLAYTCMGCHGIANYKNVYPTYNVPKLAGQSAEYVVIALTGYKNGSRGHGTMHSHAATMSDQDMQDIAAYFGGEAKIERQANVSAEAAPKAAQVCVACHGADGIALLPIYPTLAGQHADYIEQALHEYRAGSRKDPVMTTFAGQLKEEEIKEIAHYFSSRQPGLATAKPAH
jgi:cytochrome c553